MQCCTRCQRESAVRWRSGFCSSNKENGSAAAAGAIASRGSSVRFPHPLTGAIIAAAVDSRETTHQATRKRHRSIFLQTIESYRCSWRANSAVLHSLCECNSFALLTARHESNWLLVDSRAAFLGVAEEWLQCCTAQVGLVRLLRFGCRAGVGATASAVINGV